jgi:F-type H+-transporting ATPase subunit delta
MSVAKSYAKALYQAAIEVKAIEGGLDSIEIQMDEVIAAVGSSRDAWIALTGPITSVKEKTALLAEIAKRIGVAPILEQFLFLLARKGRMSLITEIREAFGVVRLQAEGGIEGKLVAADTVNGADLDDLSKAFSQKLGKRVAFRVSTDPELLAGIRVTVGGVTYDGTLRAQIQQLRDRLVSGYSG